MILIKIDSLSTSELRSIAESEGIEESDSLTRDDLIAALTDKYEEDGDYIYSEEIGQNESSRNLRYMAGITDFREISEIVNELPGVEELPEIYPETSIHLLFKNASWGYCFWSISPIETDKINHEGGELYLHVILTGEKKEEFDIPVTLADHEWNIGFSNGSEKCQVLLVYDKDGKKTELCDSQEIDIPVSYWLTHKEEMKDNETILGRYLSVITTKEGELSSNTVVREIISAFEKEIVR